MDWVPVKKSQGTPKGRERCKLAPVKQKRNPGTTETHMRASILEAEKNNIGSPVHCHQEARRRTILDRIATPE